MAHVRIATLTYTHIPLDVKDEDNLFTVGQLVDEELACMVEQMEKRSYSERTRSNATTHTSHPILHSVSIDFNTDDPKEAEAMLDMYRDWERKVGPKHNNPTRPPAALGDAAPNIKFTDLTQSTVNTKKGK